MSFSVDPPRRPGPARRTRKSGQERSEDTSGAEATETSNLPVAVGRPETIHPATPPHGPSAVEAQILGQTGARRGLRAGPGVIDSANSAYNKTHWSGEKDRRTPKGRAAKTEI